MRPLLQHHIGHARALRTLQVSHALHALLAAVAWAMGTTGSASISQLSVNLGISWDSVRLMISANEELFEQVTDGTKPRGYLRQFRLTQAGLSLLAKITKTTELCLPTQ